MCERDWSICSSSTCCGRYAVGTDTSALEGKIMGYVCAADAEVYTGTDSTDYVFECIDMMALGGIDQASNLLVAGTLIIGLLQLI